MSMRPRSNSPGDVPGNGKPQLIVADVHADPKALEAIVALAGDTIGRRIFLGDAVGYGYDPAGALALLKSFDVRLMGNHDLLVTGQGDPGIYSNHARTTILRHRDQLGPGECDRIRLFQPSYTAGPIVMYHGTPDDIYRYVFNESDVRDVLEANPDFDIFIGGHLHLARVASCDRATDRIEFEDIDFPTSRHELNLSRYRYVINCPSVTPGRFGFEFPGCCRLTPTAVDSYVLEFLFVAPYRAQPQTGKASGA
jgi:predicted phosphodiesterase